MDLTPKERREIIELYDTGLGIMDVASQLGLGKKVVTQVLHNSGADMQKDNFILLYDPDRTFNPGASFGRVDVCTTCWVRAWVPGMRFKDRKSQHEYIVEEYEHGEDVRQRLVNEVMVLEPKNSHTFREVMV